MSSCRKCSAILTDLNWSPSRKAKSDRICKPCKSGEMKSFREYHKEQKEYSKGICRCVGCNEILTETNTYPTNKVRCKFCIASNAKRWQEVKGLQYLLWAGARSRARKNNIPFNLDVEDIEIPDVCPVYGVPLERAEGKGAADNSPTLDKIIPSLGYVKGNVVVISWKANRLKSNGSLEDFESLVEWLREIQ